LNSVIISDNSLERHFDKEIEVKKAGLGQRIKIIQQKNGLTNLQTAALMNITEKQLSAVLCGKAELDLKTLDTLKQNFEVSIDWLLYGA